MGLSVTIITKNEENNIHGCLESVAWADEIVVVDSHSTDRTIEIASEYTDRIFTREFNGFSEQKQFALSNTSQDWVLNIDADERISPALKEEIRTILKDVSSFSGYWIPRLTSYLGRPIRHCGWYPNYQLRLFRRDRSSYPMRLVHERVEVQGELGWLKENLLHFSYTSFIQHIEKQQAYAVAMAEQMLNDGKKSSSAKVAITPLLSFLKKYILQKGCLDGMEGFLISSVHSYYDFMKYAQLLCLQKYCGNGKEDAE